MQLRDGPLTISVGYTAAAAENRHNENLPDQSSMAVPQLR